MLSVSLFNFWVLIKVIINVVEIIIVFIYFIVLWHVFVYVLVLDVWIFKWKLTLLFIICATTFFFHFLSTFLLILKDVISYLFLNHIPKLILANCTLNINLKIVLLRSFAYMGVIWILTHAYLFIHWFKSRSFLLFIIAINNDITNAGVIWKAIFI